MCSVKKPDEVNSNNFYQELTIYCSEINEGRISCSDTSRTRSVNRLFNKIYCLKCQVNFSINILFFCSAVFSGSTDNMGTIRSFNSDCDHHNKIVKFGITYNVRRSTNCVGYQPEEISKKFERNTGVRS